MITIIGNRVFYRDTSGEILPDTAPEPDDDGIWLELAPDPLPDPDCAKCGGSGVDGNDPCECVLGQLN